MANSVYGIAGNTTTAADLKYFRQIITDTSSGPTTWYKGLGGDMWRTNIYSLANTITEDHGVFGQATFAADDWYICVGSNSVSKPSIYTNEIRFYHHKGEALNSLVAFLHAVLAEMNVSTAAIDDSNKTQEFYLLIDQIQDRGGWIWRPNAKPPVRDADATLHVYYDFDIYVCWAANTPTTVNDLSGNANGATFANSIGGDQDENLLEPFARVNDFSNNAAAGYNYLTLNNDIEIDESSWLLVNHTGQRTSNQTTATPRYVWSAENGGGEALTSNPYAVVGFDFGGTAAGIASNSSNKRHSLSVLAAPNGYTSQISQTIPGSTAAAQFSVLNTIASTPTGFNQIGADFVIGAHPTNFGQKHPGWIGVFHIYEFAELFFDNFSVANKALINKVVQQHNMYRIDTSF